MIPLVPALEDQRNLIEYLQLHLDPLDDVIDTWNAVIAVFRSKLLFTQEQRDHVRRHFRYAVVENTEFSNGDHMYVLQWGLDDPSYSGNKT